MTTLLDLDSWLAAQDASDAVLQSVAATAAACVAIGKVVASGAIGDNLGLAGAVNVQDEDQKKLDVISNDILGRALLDCSAVAGIGSEELETVQPTGRVGGVLVVFDPLDGSSNLDINAPVGTIFSILPASADHPATEADFLQPGRNQLCAGYVIYGPQTSLVLTVSDGVAGFTLDADDTWRLTHDAIQVPRETREFAINMSNQRHWAEPVRAYIADCLQGREGPRGKDFNMRWIAAMVADVHRILMRGGIFLYPWDAREPGRPGKLRLLYEGAPMALLIERAGGMAIAADGPILDVAPETLHERVSVILGSADEVERLGRPAIRISGS